MTGAEQVVGQGLALTVSGAVNILVMGIVAFAVWSIKRHLIDMKDKFTHLEAVITHLDKTITDFKLEVAQNYATKGDIEGLRNSNETSHGNFWKENRLMSDRLTRVETRQEDALQGGGK